MARLPSPSRAPAGLLAALVFLVVVAQSPHLVHHLFENDPDGSACLLALAAERTPGLASGEAGLLPGPGLAGCLPLAEAGDPDRAPIRPTDARAPPPALLA